MLLEKLTVSQTVLHFSAFYGTFAFFTRAGRFSLCWAKEVQSKHPPFCWKFRFNFSFPSMPKSSKCFFTSGFRTLSSMYRISPTYLPHKTPPPCNPFLYPITRVIFGVEYRPWNSSLCILCHSPVISFHLGPNIFLSIQFSNTLSFCSLVRVTDQISRSCEARGKIIFCRFSHKGVILFLKGLLRFGPRAVRVKITVIFTPNLQLIM